MRDRPGENTGIRYDENAVEILRDIVGEQCGKQVVGIVRVKLVKSGYELRFCA